MSSLATQTAPAVSRGWVYGAWVNAVIAALAMVATLPGRTHGLGLVTKPLLCELNLDIEVYGAINLWATLFGALFCLPWGWLIDRVGARAMLAATMISLGVVVIAMGQIQQAWTVSWGLPVPTWLAESGTWALSVPMDLFLLVLLTRGLGQSALSVVSITLLGQSTGRRSGTMVGVYSFLVAVGFMLSFSLIKMLSKPWEPESLAPLAGSSAGLAGAPFGCSQLLAASALFPGRAEPDWRGLWSAIGAVVLAFGLLGWLFVFPSSSKKASGHSAPSPEDPETIDYTLGQALRSPAFWVFGIAASLYGLVAAGISLFNQSILEEKGFPRDVFLTITALMPLVGLASNLGSGWLATRWPLGRILAMSMVILATALVCFPLVTTLAHVYVYAVAMGTAGGMVTVIFFAVWSQVYGKRHLGQIQGAAQMLTVLASALGPSLIAACKARTGSYLPFFLGVAPICVVLAVAAWWVPLPASDPASAKR